MWDRVCPTCSGKMPVMQKVYVSKEVAYAINRAAKLTKKNKGEVIIFCLQKFLDNRQKQISASQKQI